jgi:prophage maintenance system killer protein
MAQLEIYRSPVGPVSFEVITENETVWLSADQLSELFGRDKSTISRHLRNVFSDGEVERDAVVAEFATTASDGKTYRVVHYSLDVVISVGYRVKSHEGVHFRRWASSVLKQYLLDGVALNEQRLEQIGRIVEIIGRSPDEMVSGVADVLTRYLPGLRLLRDYDAGELTGITGATPGWGLTIFEARSVIAAAAQQFPADRLFGEERGEGLNAVVETIYQGFEGTDLYPSVEEKAANLLYLVVKDHPLADGNKRSAAALFVTFLARNGILDSPDGAPSVSNNALAALTLMVAMSDPREKPLIIALIMQMLDGDSPGAG